jgi:hypothetical protein
MAAGLGFKTFTTGEVLTAADTNGYLMQGVLVFADAAARDAAITSPAGGAEGQFAQALPLLLYQPLIRIYKCVELLDQEQTMLTYA